MIGFKGFFGSGQFWNDQPHAYNGSGCIPSSLQCYEGLWVPVIVTRISLIGEQKTTRVQQVLIEYLHLAGTTRVIKGISISHSLKQNWVQRLFGSGRFWNNQPHAYNGSGCIPPSLQCYGGCCHALKLDSGTKFSQKWFDLEGFVALDGFETINHTCTTGPVVFLHCSGAMKVIGIISISLLAKA